jgi:hypothetical protein
MLEIVAHDQLDRNYGETVILRQQDKERLHKPYSFTVSGASLGSEVPAPFLVGLGQI